LLHFFFLLHGSLSVPNVHIACYVFKGYHCQMQNCLWGML
jgi:hypothetical protein